MPRNSHIVSRTLLLLIAPALFGQTFPGFRAVIDKYCVTCHNDKAKIGGLTLENLDLDRIPADADIWEKVIRKVRVGMMPPQGTSPPRRRPPATPSSPGFRPRSTAPPPQTPIPAAPSCIA